MRVSRSPRSFLTRAILIAGAFLGQSVLAAPPSIGDAATIPIPTVGGSVTVNLRQLGVLSGSAPLTLGSAQMLVNGQTTATLVATVARTGGPGAVCVTIRNADFTVGPGANVLSLRVAVSNLNQQTAGPTTVSVTNGAGPTPDLSTCGDPNATPTANAGADRVIPDSDGVAGETVVLSGAGSTDPNPGTVLTYRWTRAGVALGGPSTSPVLSTSFPDGTHNVQLTVTDDSGDTQTASASDTVQIVVEPPRPQPPTVSAGNDRTIADTNGEPGEIVTLTATATDSDGTIQNISWLDGNTLLGTGATIQAPLPDGPTDIRVTVTDNSGLTASDSVRITVSAPQIPLTVNAGADRTVADTNNAPGESVTLTATANDPQTVQSYTWRLNSAVLGTGATIQAPLPDGVNDVTVTAVSPTTGLTASDTVRITVAAPVQPPTVDAGADRTVADTNGVAGETVTLTATTNDPQAVQSYTWRLNGAVLGTGATIQAPLPDGANDVTVTAVSVTSLTASDTVRITVTAPAQPPTVDAGADRAVADTNGVAGETVTLTATTNDPQAVQSYTWRLNGAVLGTGATIQAPLPDGANDVTVTAVSVTSLTASDTVRITVAAPAQPPTVDAGADRTVADTNGVAGETVTLTVTASDPDGTVQTIVWQLGQTVLGTGATIQAPLPDGASDITVTVTDNTGLSTSDTVRITVAPPARVPTVNAGADRVIPDSNGVPGESVTLDATASDPDGTIVSYSWQAGATQLGNGTTIQAPLPDGANEVTVTVTDNSGLTASDSVQITVGATQAPTVTAGEDRTIPDTNGQPGETVTLTATASDADGSIRSYSWRRGETILGTGATIQAPLPDGASDITVTVTDNTGLTASDSVQITVGATQAPTVTAGEDRTIPDTNGQPGETVTLTATASDTDGSIQSYSWRRGETILGTGATIQAPLPDGVSDVTVTVTDNTGLSASDAVRITIVAASAPVANAGADRTVADTDGAAGETVALSGTGTDTDGTIASYQWFIGQTPLATSQNIQAPLPDGVSVVTLVVTDNTGNTGSDSVQVTVNGSARPTANAGADRSIADSDGQTGEAVALTGTGTDADGTIASFDWMIGETSLGSGSTLQSRLPDGVTTVMLRVTDNVGNVGTDTVQITVGAVVPPVANAGNDRKLTDTDREAGEMFVLSGSGSTRSGTIVSYQWFRNDELLGSGNPLEVRLPDGVNTITLMVTTSVNTTSTDVVQITVAAPLVRTPLADLPDLNPTQKSVAQSLDRICTELDDAIVAGDGLTVEQRALNRRCDGLYFGNTAANQTEALGELVTDNFAVARTQTLLFANTQYASVMDRLIALRGGARGLSLAGLNITMDGASIPLAELQEFGKQLLGGGASADAREAGGLLDEKVGLWARGNYSFGKKDTESSSPGFDADQWSLVGGADYRISTNAVVGAAIAYGDANVEFNSNDGALRTRSWALSLYGSMYAGRNLYLDGIINVADAGYDADRNIAYVDGQGLVQESARGSTSGLTLSAGLSGGYDFLVGGLTVSPTLGVYYIQATLDSFTENGASGLNLLYDKQEFTSLTGNLGLRMTYSLNLPFGVLLPHLRVDYVREFNDDLDVFSVRFAADPDGTNAAPILVQTDNPDHSYFRISAGMSAQLRFGLSGYFEYQRLQSFEAISFQDVSFGVRAQRSF